MTNKKIHLSYYNLTRVFFGGVGASHLQINFCNRTIVFFLLPEKVWGGVGAGTPLSAPPKKNPELNWQKIKIKKWKHFKITKKTLRCFQMTKFDVKISSLEPQSVFFVNKETQIFIFLTHGSFLNTHHLKKKSFVLRGGIRGSLQTSYLHRKFPYPSSEKVGSGMDLPKKKREVWKRNQVRILNKKFQLFLCIRYVGKGGCRAYSLPPLKSGLEFGFWKRGLIYFLAKNNLELLTQHNHVWRKNLQSRTSNRFFYYSMPPPLPKLEFGFVSEFWKRGTIYFLPKNILSWANSTYSSKLM